MMSVRSLAKYIVRGGFFLLFLASLALAFSHLQSVRIRQATASCEQPVPHRIVTRRAELGSAVKTIPALAHVESFAKVRVPVEIAGRILTMTKREGDIVKEGEVLARLEVAEPLLQRKAADASVSAASSQIHVLQANLRSLQAQKSALKANVEFLSAETDRDRQLFEGGAISRSAWEASRNRLIDAQSRLRAVGAQTGSLQAQISGQAAKRQAAEQTAGLWKVREGYSQLTAPTDGIIAQRLQEPGQYVGPGTPLFILEDTRQTKLTMQVPQDRAHLLVQGQKVLLAPKAWGATGSSDIYLSRVYPTANQARQVTVEATISSPGQGLRYGMQLPARIVVKEKAGVLLAPEMVFSGMGAAKFVYVVVDGQAVRKEIHPSLIANDGSVVIPKGILPPSANLMVAPFLAHARLPASFPVEVFP